MVLVLTFFCYLRLLLDAWEAFVEAEQAEGRDATTRGFVTMIDFLYNATLREYALGVLTIPMFRRLKDTASIAMARWRKFGVPLTSALSPSEDTDHHRLKMTLAKGVLAKILIVCSLPVPVPLIHQTHGDWSRNNMHRNVSFATWNIFSEH